MSARAAAACSERSRACAYEFTAYVRMKLALIKRRNPSTNRKNVPIGDGCGCMYELYHSPAGAYVNGITT